jgi:DNA-directed RNA polymerase specialized sigma24 family protein
MLEQSAAEFPLTRWSLVDALCQGSAEQREQALKSLAETYWPAIYGFLRRGGSTREQAVEITQAFFLEKILEEHLFEKADPSRGSMRKLIRTSVKNFAIDQHRRATSGPTMHLFTNDELDAEDALICASKEMDPDRMFERRWAVAVLTEALGRCEFYFGGKTKRLHWEAFERRVVRPCLAMTPPPSHQSIAQELGLANGDACVDMIKVVRKRLLILLRQVIAETIVDAAEQEAEYGRVLDLLS